MKTNKGLLCLLLLSGCAVYGQPEKMTDTALCNAVGRRDSTADPFLIVSQQNKTALVNELKSRNILPANRLGWVLAHDVRMGMGSMEVMCALGTPADINRTRSANGTSEQWVYRSADHGSRYIYFRNGSVTTIQD